MPEENSRAIPPPKAIKTKSASSRFAEYYLVGSNSTGGSSQSANPGVRWVTRMVAFELDANNQIPFEGREESRCRMICEIFLLAEQAVHCRQMSMLRARECSAEKATTGPWGIGSDRTA